MNKFKFKIIICLIISAIILANTLPLFKKVYSAETAITLETLSGGEFLIEYLGRSEDKLTWNYQITEAEGSRDLSHWVLGLFECFTEENIIETTPEYSDFNTDPTTDVYGLKWDVDDSFNSGVFSITFDRIYEKSEEGIEVAVKTGGNPHEGEDGENTKIAAGSITGPSCNVENTEEICEIGPLWAFEVAESNQGTLNNGNQINDPNRTNPEFALNEQDGNFFSLGKNGEIILGFENYIFDVQEESPEDIFGNGYDLAIYETTWGREGYPEERATVSISQDGAAWHEIGTAGNHDNETGISYFDIASLNLAWFKYVKITELTDFSLHGSDADGYDLDAVSAAYSCTQLPEVDPANLILIKTPESLGVYPGEYLTYKLSYINIGEDPACNVIITETVPQYTKFEGLPGWHCFSEIYPAQSGTECTYEIGEVQPGESGEVVFTVKIDDEILNTDQILNMAEISADDEEYLDDNTSTAITALLQIEAGDGENKEGDEEDQKEEKNSDQEQDGGQGGEENKNPKNGENNNKAENIDPVTAPILQPAVLKSEILENPIITEPLQGSQETEINNPSVLAATGRKIIPVLVLGCTIILISTRFRIIGRNL